MLRGPGGVTFVLVLWKLGDLGGGGVGVAHSSHSRCQKTALKHVLQPYRHSAGILKDGEISSSLASIKRVCKDMYYIQYNDILNYLWSFHFDLQQKCRVKYNVVQIQL